MHSSIQLTNQATNPDSPDVVIEHPHAALSIPINDVPRVELTLPLAGVQLAQFDEPHEQAPFITGGK